VAKTVKNTPDDFLLVRIVNLRATFILIVVQSELAIRDSAIVEKLALVYTFLRRPIFTCVTSQDS